VVAALFLAQSAGDGSELEQVAFLLDLDLLGGDLLVATACGKAKMRPDDGDGDQDGK
jgi:hypothetical protein